MKTSYLSASLQKLSYRARWRKVNGVVQPQMFVEKPKIHVHEHAASTRCKCRLHSWVLSNKPVEHNWSARWRHVHIKSIFEGSLQTSKEDIPLIDTAAY
jgi:poly(3-hydroxybutyrate) depolymerase